MNIQHVLKVVVVELKSSQDLKQLRRSMEENVQTYISFQELATHKTVLVTFFFNKFSSYSYANLCPNSNFDFAKPFATIFVKKVDEIKI